MPAQTSIPSALLSKVLKPSSRSLAALALGVWLLSLPLTGLVLYSNQMKLSGLGILAMGWLSPLMLNFAWFANPFFLIAILKLLLGNKSASKSAGAAALISLDTFRFDEYMLNEGGASTPVYGYGYGAILWLAAIFILLVAAGFREREQKTVNTNYDANDAGSTLCMLGIAALLGLLCTSLALATIDRRKANQKERERLSDVVFKKNEVCQLEAPTASVVFRLSGPIELVGDPISYPFNSPLTLLNWGIPAVRSKDVDYQLIKGRNFDGILAKSAEGSAVARLISKYESRPDRIGSIYHTALTSADGKVTSFEQTWKPEKRGARYCPERSSFPGQNDEPRRVLMSAIDIKPESAKLDAIDPTASPGGSKVARLEPSIVGRFSVPPRGSLANLGCQSGTGYRGFSRLEKYPETWELGDPFRVGEKYYYPGWSKFTDAICVGGDAFIYSSHQRGDGLYFRIQKRSIDSFAEEWTAVFKLPTGTEELEEKRTKIIAVREKGNKVSIDLLHDTKYKGITFEAVLPTQ